MPYDENRASVGRSLPSVEGFPAVMVSRLQRSAPRTYGSTRLPVRTNNDLTVNGPPDGWVADQLGPVAWDSGVANGGIPPVWWIGVAPEDGRSPIGPHGPNLVAAGAAVTRATSLIVDPLVSDPFIVQANRVGPEPGERLPSPRWITDPQLLRPDSRFHPAPTASQRKARSVFWRGWVKLALYWGRGYLYFLEDNTGQPMAGTLRTLDPHLVEVDEYTLRYVVHGAAGEVLEFDHDGYRADGNPGRIVRLDNPIHPNGVFAAHPDVFALNRKLARYTEGTFNSGVPAGYLKATSPGLTQPQADVLKAKWMENHGGDRRSIAVLNATTEFHPIALNPVDAALVQVKNSTLADLAYAFGLAPEVLSVSMGTSNTYSNIRDWWRLHRDFGLSPWVDAIGGTLTALIPAGADVAVDLDGHSRPDEADRMDIYAKGIACGVYTVNEARAKEGRLPLTPKELSA